MKRIYLKNELFEGIISKEEYLGMEYHNKIEKEGCVLIAIHDPDRSPHPDNRIQGFDDVLQIHFWDLEYIMGDKHIITTQQGTIIQKFIYKNIDKRFLIHCSAGISRSAGVGLAVECIVKFNGLKLDYSLYKSAIKNYWRYSPNYVVYDAII